MSENACKQKGNNEIVLYVNQEVQDLLDEIGSSFEESPNKIDTIIEFRHLALTGEVKYDGDDLDISIFERDEKNTKSYLGMHGKVVDMAIYVDKGDDYTIMVAAGISDYMNNYFYENNLYDKYRELDDKSGVLVEAIDGKIVTTIVSGKERPDLKCRMDSGEKQMYRPYMDE